MVCHLHLLNSPSRNLLRTSFILQFRETVAQRHQRSFELQTEELQRKALAAAKRAEDMISKNEAEMQKLLEEANRKKELAEQLSKERAEEEESYIFDKEAIERLSHNRTAEPKRRAQWAQDAVAEEELAELAEEELPLT